MTQAPDILRTMVLTVSPIESDHETLNQILLAPKWILHKALNLPSALRQFRRHQRISVVLCERDLLPGTWKDLLASVQLMPNPPRVIVASRFADERLWAEALNLGVHDVLAKPFDATEVQRVCLAWVRCRGIVNTTPHDWK
jgi:response regulator RpfG family c-di-GMP phosphodiesterase